MSRPRASWPEPDPQVAAAIAAVYREGCVTARAIWLSC